MIRRLRCDPYPAVIYLTNTRMDFLKMRGVSADDPEPANLGIASGITWSSDHEPLRFVVGIFHERYVPIMAHEFGHVTIRLFSGIGMPITLDTQEAFCYFMDYLVRQGEEFFEDVERERQYQLVANPPMTAASGW